MNIQQYGINGIIKCPVENENIIVQGTIVVTDIKRSDTRGSHNMVFGRPLMIWINNEQLNPNDGIDLDITLIDVKVNDDEVNNPQCRISEDATGIIFNPNSRTDKTITYTIQVNINGIDDRRDLQRIEFQLHITDDKKGCYGVDVNLVRGFNCENCRNYYDNLFRINANDVIFNGNRRYDIATISTNNDTILNPDFPIWEIDRIPKKRYSVNDGQAVAVNVIPNPIDTRIGAPADLNLRFQTDPFLCYNGVNINKTINVKNTVLGLEAIVMSPTDEILNPVANNNGNTINLGDIEIPDPNSSRIYTLRLNNTAQVVPQNARGHHYHVRIDNVVVTPNANVLDNTNVLDRIEGWEANRDAINEDFLIQNRILGVILNPGEHTDLSVVFDGNHLSNIKIDDNNINYIELNLNFTINYTTIANQTQNQGVRITYILTARLFRRRPSVQYSVDFGTSAIVACKRIGGKIYIIDLKTGKNQLFDKMVDDKKINISEDKVIDESEPADNLIASTMSRVERDGAGLQDADRQGAELQPHELYYYEKQYWFSPTSNLTHVGKHLPCLKTMVGRERFGNIDVTNVIKEAYRQLCKYFLKGERIESLSLTVPNTFNILQRRQLEEVIYNNIHDIAKPCEINKEKFSYLTFISESDSVLYSYIYNAIGERRQGGVEHVLVYDMGAGTLDITYAKCTFQNVNGVTTCSGVEVLGRTGTNKAGNYIDSLLGYIICDLLTDERNRELINNLLNNNNGAAEQTSLKVLKQFLRDNVKTRLNNINENIFVPSEGQDYFNIEGNDIKELNGIAIQDIVNSNKFKDFVNDCTKTILGDFRKMYGDNGYLKVDTIVVSGRTVEINGIRNNIKEFFNNKNSDRKINYLRIDGRAFDGNNENVVNANDGTPDPAGGGNARVVDNNNRTLKTAVAEGALAYKDYGENITERYKLYGHYGIICRCNGLKEFVHGSINNNGQNQNLSNCILLGIYNTNNFVGVENNGSISGNMTIRYPNLAEITLYHSYYSIDTIVSDVNNGKFDKITKLHKCETVNQKQNNNVSIVFDVNNGINYSVNGIRPNINLIDDINSDTLKMCLWPVSIPN